MGTPLRPESDWKQIFFVFAFLFVLFLVFRFSVFPKIPLNQIFPQRPKVDLVFYSERNSQPGIYFLRAGAPPESASLLIPGMKYASFSPDGSSVIASNGSSKMAAVTRDGEKLADIDLSAKGIGIFSPRFMRNGRDFLFIGRPVSGAGASVSAPAGDQIYFYEQADGIVKPVTLNKEAGMILTFDISPADNSIALIRRLPDGKVIASLIDTASRQSIIFAKEIYNLQWTPDGEKIIFSAPGRAKSPTEPGPHILLKDGSQWRSLYAYDLKRNEGFPFWPYFDTDPFAFSGLRFTPDGNYFLRFGPYREGTAIFWADIKRQTEGVFVTADFRGEMNFDVR